MRVLLIDPPGPCRGINAGLGYLAGTLTQHNIDVLVLDLTNKNDCRIEGWGGENPQIGFSNPEIEIKNTLKSFTPELIGISTKTFTADIVSKIIDIVKSVFPEIPVVVGGAHITLDGIKFLQDSNADIGIIGEGEITLVELAESIRDNRHLKEINGIIYRENGKVIQTSKRKFVNDIDTFVFPQYDCFTSIKYNSNKIVNYPLLTSRGCPYSCTYCSVGIISGKKWRGRTPENVITELTHAKKKYKIESFIVIDDNFTFDIERAKNICDAIISANLGLNWSCPNGIRADRCDKELFFMMRKSGCKEIAIGVESADEHVFNAVKKGETLEDIEKAIIIAKDTGISVSGFFILGLPYSTLESDLKSIKFAKKRGINIFCGNLIPYPYTETWNYVQNYGKTLRDFKNSYHAVNKPEPIFETKEYSEKDRIKAFYTIHLRTGNYERLVALTDSKISKLYKLYYYSFRYDLKSVLKLTWWITLYLFKSLQKFKRT